MLRGGGDYKAYLAIRPALSDANAAIRDAAIRSLADWPDPTPAAVLLERGWHRHAPRLPFWRLRLLHRGLQRLAGKGGMQLGDEALPAAGPGTSGPGTSGPRTSGPGTSGPGTSGPGTSGDATEPPLQQQQRQQRQQRRSERLCRDYGEPLRELLLECQHLLGRD